MAKKLKVGLTITRAQTQARPYARTQNGCCSAFARKMIENSLPLLTADARLTADDRLLGCIVGGAIGDAWGSAYEGHVPPFDVSLDMEWRLTDRAAEPRRGQDAVRETALVSGGKREVQGVAVGRLAVDDRDSDGVRWSKELEAVVRGAPRWSVD